MRRYLLIALALVLVGPPTGANGAAERGRSLRTDTLSLSELRAAAREREPAGRRTELAEALARLEELNITTSWYPSLELGGSASYQSEVPQVGSIPLPSASQQPGGSSFAMPEPPRDQYGLTAEVSQLVWDGGRSERRRSVNRARLAEERAAVESSLFEIERAVDRVFFAALLAQEQRTQLRTLAADLLERRELVRARARTGAGLSSDTAAIEAELLGIRQRIAEAEAGRRAALAVLEDLTGRTAAPGDVLAAPEVEETVARIRSRLDRPGAFDGTRDSLGREGSFAGLLERPEVERLDRTAELLSAQAQASELGDRPVIRTFVRGAYGRPGLNLFDDSFGPHLLAGLRVNWAVWDWERSEREARSLQVRAEEVRTRRSSLVAGMRRETYDELFEIDRLEEALREDERIIDLRSALERTARRRMEEGVLVPAEYVDRRTDLFDARLRRRRHRVELVRARIRLLRILGRSGEPGAPPALESTIEAPGSALSDLPGAPAGVLDD